MRIVVRVLGFEIAAQSSFCAHPWMCSMLYAISVHPFGSYQRSSLSQHRSAHHICNIDLRSHMQCIRNARAHLYSRCFGLPTFPRRTMPRLAEVHWEKDGHRVQTGDRTAIAILGIGPVRVDDSNISCEILRWNTFAASSRHRVWFVIVRIQGTS